MYIDPWGNDPYRLPNPYIDPRPMPLPDFSKEWSNILAAEPRKYYGKIDFVSGPNTKFIVREFDLTSDYLLFDNSACVSLQLYVTGIAKYEIKVKTTNGQLIITTGSKNHKVGKETPPKFSGFEVAPYGQWVFNLKNTKVADVYHADGILTVNLREFTEADQTTVHEIS